MADSLARYRAKRDFKTTQEPRGGERTAKGNRFVIQKHSARRLHYDFRLELDGVLKSWAVTRGPSMVPGEKRLAVHVEDHPLDYASFEGTIPKGEYGGGSVIVWDEGRWAPLGDAHKGLSKGHLEFKLAGKKLTGRWHLIRMRGKPGERGENWLLIKGEDEAARSAGQPDILEERPESVKSGKLIEEIGGSKPPRAGAAKPRGVKPPAKPVRKSAAKPDNSASPALLLADNLKPGDLKNAAAAPLPPFVEPALALLKASPPAGAQWLHEIKFDGYRLQARLEAGRVKLLTRSGLDWTRKFGKAIIEAFQALPAGKALIDGELVVESEFGSSDFSALQSDLSEGRTGRFVFYAFDLLHLDGYDLRKAKLLERKSLLLQLLQQAGQPSGGLLRYSEHFTEAGALVLQHACRLSLEGVVSKKADGAYRSGREGSWIKSKCTARQEFVVAGYVPSTVSRKAIGSLVLGVHDNGKLTHVGRAGTGFPVRVAEDLKHKLDAIAQPESPFAERLSREEASQVHFVRPTLVAEVEFRGWTGDGNLRHASFRGLRDDKSAADVVRETPVKKGSTMSDERQRSVKLTHPDRVYWPDAGLTKAGLVDYYAAVWPLLGPLIVNRPLALLRCPEGIEGQSFFQKHGWRGMRKEIATMRDPGDRNGEDVLYITGFDGLAALVQGAALEIHPWGSTLSELEKPDMITMDLDPGEGVGWDALVAAAQETAERLRQAGLAAFVKTSGGKGLHVVSPLTPAAPWAEVKSFTKAIADAMAGDSPKSFVSTITKSKRKGKILVDYLRNQRGMTAICAYSTRARPGAPVSMPIAWDEVSQLSGAAHFTAANALNRIAALTNNPWADFKRAATPLVTGAKTRKRS